jgi:hypothetical protein
MTSVNGLALRLLQTIVSRAMSVMNNVVVPVRVKRIMRCAAPKEQ